MHFIIILLESREFRLELALGAGKVDIDGGEFVHTYNSFLMQLFSGTLGTKGLFKVDSHLLELGLQGLASALGNTELVNGLLQLTMNLIVVGLKLL